MGQNETSKGHAVRNRLVAVIMAGRWGTDSPSISKMSPVARPTFVLSKGGSD